MQYLGVWLSDIVSTFYLYRHYYMIDEDFRSLVDISDVGKIIQSQNFRFTWF